MNDRLFYFFVFVWCYFLGSIPMGYVLMRFGKDMDIRKFGSGNIGMTNVWRVAGPAWGIATLFLDIGKGVGAILVSRMYSDLNIYDPQISLLPAAVGVLLGNLFPIYLKFKGGKGVGTSIGVFYTLAPLESLAATVVFFTVIWLTRMVSVSSLAAVTFLAVYAAHTHSTLWNVDRLALVVCLLVWWSHRANVLRIMDGTERRIDKKPVPLWVGVEFLKRTYERHRKGAR